MGQYAQPHTRRWADVVRGLDAFVFVTPSTTTQCQAHGRPPSTSCTPSGTTRRPPSVGYGADGGVRAIEQIRQVMANLKVADVGPQVALSLRTDFVNLSRFQPDPRHEATLKTMLD
jgi:NAD(P)H-dependent FMN reductase